MTDDLPQYVAQIREFDTAMEAKRFSQEHDGIVVPGQPWCLIFAGVIDSTNCPIHSAFEEMTREFLQQAANWLSINV